MNISTIRKIETSSKEIFLTFDDGPNDIATPFILDILKEYQVTATFFVIAEKLISRPQLVKRIQQEGHAIGNHSLDHRYSAFFAGREKIKDWVSKSEKILEQSGVSTNVGFRPPVGIRTPELFWALKQLQIPLVLWNVRFYDTVFTWKTNRALQSLINMPSGSIVLLHDNRKPNTLFQFGQTLRSFIEEAQSKNYQFKALTRSLCLSQYQN